MGRAWGRAWLPIATHGSAWSIAYETAWKRVGCGRMAFSTKNAPKRALRRHACQRPCMRTLFRDTYPAPCAISDRAHHVKTGDDDSEN